VFPWTHRYGQHDLPHVPSIGLVVAGRQRYNDVHLHLESQRQTRKDWIAALDTIESLSLRVLSRDTKRPAQQIRRISSKKRENTFATLTGPLPILTRRWNSTTRCFALYPDV